MSAASLISEGPGPASGPGNARARLGGKGAALQQLLDWGLPVPEFMVISSGELRFTLRANGLHDLEAWLDDPTAPLPCPVEDIAAALGCCEIPEAVTRAVQAFIGRSPSASFAVRSSASLEDGAASSFAGLFTTVLNVREPDDLWAAIRTCWSAAFDPRVRTYLAEQAGGAPLELALVVQQLVPAERSGVLFSVDPVHGADTEMLIEACFGLGEALVAGQVSPDQYLYDWRADQLLEQVIASKTHQCVRLPRAPFVELQPLPAEQVEAPVLSPAQLRELVSLGVEIQARSGRPVDVEWAWANGRFHILQSRPITRLGFAAIDGEWTTADFRDGGVSATVCTPLMASLYQSVMDVTMPACLRRLGFRLRAEDRQWLRVFYSRPYWNLGAVKHYLAQIPGFKERTFDAGLGIVPRYEGDGVVAKLTPATLIAGLRALWSIKRGCRRRLAGCPAFAAAQRQRLRQLRALDLSQLDDAELWRFCGAFLEREYFHSEASYFDLIYDNSNLNGLFLQKLAGLNFPSSEIPLLFSGLEEVSHLAPMAALWQLRDRIAADSELRACWLESSAADLAARYLAGDHSQALDLLAEFLERFGHHAERELDLLAPRYAEDPQTVVRQVQEVLRQPAELDPRPRNQLQQQRAVEAAARLLQAVPAWRRPGLRRELALVRQFLWWREELRDLSTRYYQQVRRLVLEVDRRLLAQGITESAGDVFFLTKDQLLAFLNQTSSAADARQQVRTQRCYYRGFADFVIPDEIGTRYTGPAPTLAAASDPHGVAGSPGVATGVARVIADLSDSERLRPGDILVTRCTDPGWTPKFSMLSGVVTETGGILSHAAVICREYGIPAVLAVSGATRRIRDGQTITIDGNHGRVLLQSVEDICEEAD